MRHKHADLIIAWANGAEIELFYRPHGEWIKCFLPNWDVNCDYRLAPEPKPDVVGFIMVPDLDGYDRLNIQKRQPSDNLKCVWDGETGALKAAEVIS